MKKIITSVLMLVCFALCFTACSEPLGEKYWEDTSTAMTSYFFDSKGEYTGDYAKVADISFSDNIKTIISTSYGEEFAELENVYAQLYKAAAFAAEKYAAVLTVKPVNVEGEFKNKIIDVNNKFNAFKIDVTKFLEAKRVFEDRISFTAEDRVTSAVEKSRLVDFKMDYLKLIESAYNLSNSLYNAYTVGYYTFSDFENIDPENFSVDQVEINRKLAINGSNLHLVDSAINVLKIYNAKAIYYDYNNYWQVSQKFFNDVVVYAYDSNNQLPTNSTLLSKFIIWKGVYDDFESDSVHFKSIVSNLQIDILKKCNNDVIEYANKTGNSLDATNASFFLNYYKNVNILYNYTITLV